MPRCRSSGALRRYYRFQIGDDGVVDFFDETGKSNRKFLVRKPIADGQLRSTFGMRYHPILRYSRMHTGVDWANRVGTPIIAAGDGTRAQRGWDSGYGRRVEIEHAYNFVTTYSHMSAFARGIREGVARAPGAGHRLSRQQRPLHRSAPALRGHDQRELRRSARGQGAAQPRARTTRSSPPSSARRTASTSSSARRRARPASPTRAAPRRAGRPALSRGISPRPRPMLHVLAIVLPVFGLIGARLRRRAGRASSATAPARACRDFVFAVAVPGPDLQDADRAPTCRRRSPGATGSPISAASSSSGRSAALAAQRSSARRGARPWWRASAQPSPTPCSSACR